MKKIILESEVISEIVKYYLMPHSLLDTAKQFNVSKNKIARILVEANIAKHNKETSKLLGANKQSCNCIANTGYTEEEIIQYYLEPHTCNDTCNKFSLSNTTLKWLLAKYNILEHNNLTIATCKTRKAKNTCVERYGTEFYSSTDEFKQRCKATNLEKLGVENPMQIKEIAAAQLASRQQTCLNKYGTNCYFSTEEFKLKAISTRQKCYGVSFSGQIEKVKQFNHDHSTEIQKKINKTKRENNSFNTSKIENQFYNYLLNFFSIDDIIAQYDSDTRYPFRCDFYIKSRDLFIELNINWTHGGHLFDSNSIADQAKLATWQKKAEESNFYRNAIITWTKRDIKKLDIAKNNNLNYLVFYSEREALEYVF